MRGKLLAQAETVNGRRIELRETPKRRGNEIDLFQIDSAVNAGCEMQDDPAFGQGGKVVLHILGGPIRDIPARQSAADPL
jgi:hypothetical protein